jgi:eukaryotic-like serine/threonine-protein kinase
MVTIGESISHYRIVEELGHGGMGVVYRARDEHLPRDVALKVLPAGLFSDETARSRFRREAQTLSQLNHSNIATVYDFDRENGVDFLAMEFVEGETLAVEVAAGPLPEKEVVALGTQIAEALEEAHEHGIIHRDLKPGNVIVTPKGRAKVLDFGLAKLLKPADADNATASLAESQPGAVMGTVPYMSPEQLQGKPADARTDIYGLGAVLYEMATGRRPFPEAQTSQLIAAILTQAPQPAHKLNAQVSQGLEAIIQKALERNPEQRYQSAKEFLDDLERLSVPGSLVGAPRQKIESIAVLPLENLSGDPQQEYFADGMTDVLIAELGQIGSLRVISRTSVMQYKKSYRPLPQIAKELNVDAVIEGSVLRAADRVRITAQLIGAVPERHLWARNYERDLRDVLNLQGEIARTIADEIKAKVTPEVQARLARSRSVKPEAYESYLKGSYALKRIGGHAATGIQHFREAIAADPGYAPAYVGLCISYLQVGFGYGPLPPREAFAQTKHAALEALKIDPELGEAHSCLAWVKSFGEWDWCGAEESFKLAADLSPNSVEVHRMYAWHLTAMGRFEAAIAESHRAIELDPVSLAAGYASATVYQWARQPARAAAEAERLLLLDPTYPGGQVHLALTYFQEGCYEEAVRHFQKAIAGGGDDPPAFPLTWLASAYGRAGKRIEALEILNDLQARSKKKYVSPYLIALIHCNVGDRDRAFEWLEKAYAERNPMLAFLRFDFSLDPVCCDPRFQDLLRRMNFPQ